MNRLSISSFTTSLCFLSCVLTLPSCTAKVADLGNSATLASSPPPETLPKSKPLWKLVDHEQFLGGFSIARDKLLWFSGHGNTERYHEAIEQRFLRHCDVNDCAGTEFTETTEVPPSLRRRGTLLGPVVTDDSNFYWVESAEQFDENVRFESCNTEDPAQAGPPGDAAYFGLMMDGALFACSEARVLTCTASDCAVSSQDVTPFPQKPEDAVDSPCPRAAADGYLYGTSNYKVIRYRPEPGGAPFEILHVGHTEDMTEFATNGREIFWIEAVRGSGLTGVLKSCPATGCTEEPRVLMRDIGFTYGLLADQENVYVLEPQLRDETDPEDPVILPEGDRIIRVPIAGTEPPTELIKGVGVNGPMLLTEDLLYFRGVNSRYDQYIAAIPK
jgi:hypothetical protein